ncbi:MAG: GntR family transcriptional regulator [Pseudomonadota bacterium]
MKVQTTVTAGITRADILCEALEEMIVDGRLLPGERLDETELAQRFDVSRTPVREAIRALVAIGLVEAGGRQGAVVTRISASMLIEMFDLMAMLEGMCAERAARRASAEDRAVLHSVHQRLVASFDTPDPDTFYKINIEFHDRIYAAARTKFLADQAIRLRRRLAPFRMRVTYQPGRMRESITEHQAILTAIEEGKGEAARDAAIAHVKLLGNDLTDLLAMLPDKVD